MLDAHLSRQFFWLTHAYMFDHYHELLAQPIKVIPTADWLSINMIGYDWAMGRRISDMLGEFYEPHMVAGRELIGQMGDEGAVNKVPRLICQGFLAAHLTFGPQMISNEHLTAVRDRYAEIGQKCLAG